MKALSTTVIIHVSDLHKAVAYYTDVLGFEIDFEYGEYVGLTYGRLAIHLSGPTYQGLKKPSGSAHFSIFCDDIDEYYKAITAKGALITVPIADETYGLREFAVSDADGNTLVFGMDLKP